MTGTVVISGGFGYLGGRIAQALARGGWRVRLGSRTERAVPQWLPEAQSTALDVTQPGALPAALGGADAVVHLAALNEIQSMADPESAVIVNTLGTLNLLKASVAAGVKHFVFLSTAHVYGAPLVGEISERTVPRPVHPYAITHHAAEEFVLAAHDRRELSCSVLRLSNGFGAPSHPDVDRWTLLANDLCLQAARDRSMKLRSDGLQERDFITLHDVARAVAHCLELSTDQSCDGLFNLGGECTLSVWSMACRIAEVCTSTLGFTPELTRPQPSEPYALPTLRYDVGKLRRTGFAISGNMNAEIAATLRMCAAKAGGPR